MELVGAFDATAREQGIMRMARGEIAPKYAPASGRSRSIQQILE